MSDILSYFAPNERVDALDELELAVRLSKVLKIKTLGADSKEHTKWESFAELRELLQELFPLIFSKGNVELIDHSLLIHIEGTEPSLDPVLLISHQDVVPVVPGTEGDWIHDAFSGHIDEDYIWGRGALDMKSHLMGTLEAVNLLLKEMGAPKRGIYIGLGQDEETFQTGAKQIADTLLERGVHPVCLLDEGDYSIHDLSAFGLPNKHALMVCLAEKGYADIRLSVPSSGGHSSLPWGGSSLEHLSRAITMICDHDWGSAICEPVEALFTNLELIAKLEGVQLAPEISSRDVPQLAQNKELFAYVSTTVAPTMISGSSTQPNVLPQSMSATINFRMLPNIDAASIKEQVEEIVSALDCDIFVELLEGASDGSKDYQVDMRWVQLLADVVADHFVEPDTQESLPLLPSLVVGATDARLYEKLGTTCLRFSPFVADAVEIECGVHGTDERILRKAYVRGIAIISDFLTRVSYQL